MSRCKDLLERYHKAINEMSTLGYKKGIQFFTTCNYGRGRLHIHLHNAEFDISVGMPDLTILEIDYNHKPKKYKFKKGDVLASSLRKLLIDLLRQEHIALGFTGNKAMHAVNSWNNENQLYPAQQTTYEKFIGNLLD